MIPGQGPEKISRLFPDSSDFSVVALKLRTTAAPFRRLFIVRYSRAVKAELFIPRVKIFLIMGACTLEKRPTACRYLYKGVIALF